jgi:hypothetical protein
MSRLALDRQRRRQSGVRGPFHAPRDSARPRGGTESPEDFVRDAFRDDLSVSGGLLSDECASLYIGPNEEVPKGEQYNR